MQFHLPVISNSWRIFYQPKHHLNTMNKFQTIGLLGTVIVVVLVAALLKEEGFAAVDKDKLNYVDVILAQYECTVSESNKIDDNDYRCHEGTDDYVEIFIIMPEFTKDFNADGKEETFVTWSENFGGSYTGAIYGVFDGTDTIKSRTTVGDRAVIKQVYFENSLIVVDLITHGPDEALCCPTVEMTKKFQWDGQALIPAPTATVAQ